MIDERTIEEYAELRKPHIYNGETWRRVFVVRAHDALAIARRRAARPEYNVRHVDGEGREYDGWFTEDNGALITIVVHDDWDGVGVDDFDCCEAAGERHKPCGHGTDRGCVFGRGYRAAHECRHKCEEYARANDEGVYGVSLEITDAYLGETTEGEYSCWGFVGREALKEGIEEAADSAAYATAAA